MYQWIRRIHLIDRWSLASPIVDPGDRNFDPRPLSLRFQRKSVVVYMHVNRPSRHDHICYLGLITSTQSNRQHSLVNLAIFWPNPNQIAKKLSLHFCEGQLFLCNIQKIGHNRRIRN